MLVLPAELTHRQASDALRMLLQALKAQREPQVVVDAVSDYLYLLMPIRFGI